MSFRDWKAFFGFDRKLAPRRDALDGARGADLNLLLEDLALNERRPVAELQAELVSSALAERLASEQLLQTWNLLTPREQQVLALICLGGTTRQIAARLRLSPETVKTHVKSMLRKLSAHSRAELRVLFSGWDFSEWGK